MKRPDADPILRDNRKNRPRFLVICLVCLLGGAVLGYAAAAYWGFNSELRRS